MTWADFKKKVEAQGVKDTDKIWMIDLTGSCFPSLRICQSASGRIQIVSGLWKSILNDWRTVTVPKAWGRESLLTESETVAAWLLEMRAGRSTSLHSHPGKLTGYIVVEGEIELEFLNDRQRRKALDKAVIHSYVPHRTHGITDSKLIEIETPKDHANLVRFEDDYGRAGQPYEQVYLPRDEKTPYLGRDSDLTLGGWVTVGLRQIAPGYDYSVWLEALLDDTVIAVMAGGLASREGVKAVASGHVLWGRDLRRLAPILELREEMEVLVAWDSRKSVT